MRISRTTPFLSNYVSSAFERQKALLSNAGAITAGNFVHGRAWLLLLVVGRARVFAKRSRFRSGRGLGYEFAGADWRIRDGTSSDQ